MCRPVSTGSWAAANWNPGIIPSPKRLAAVSEAAWITRSPCARATVSPARRSERCSQDTSFRIGFLARPEASYQPKWTCGGVVIAFPLFPQNPITSPASTVDPAGNSTSLVSDRWA